MLGLVQAAWLNTSSAQHISFITRAVLIYKWSPGTGYHKNKLHQNYVLEINISHWSRWTWENSFAACFLKCIHKAHRRLLSNLSSQTLFLLPHVSLTAMWIWGLLLIYTKTALPHSGRARTSAETWAPSCFAHQGCSAVALAQNAAQAHKCLTRALYPELNRNIQMKTMLSLPEKL